MLRSFRRLLCDHLIQCSFRVEVSIWRKVSEEDSTENTLPNAAMCLNGLLKGLKGGRLNSVFAENPTPMTPRRTHGNTTKTQDAIGLHLSFDDIPKGDLHIDEHGSRIQAIQVFFKGSHIFYSPFTAFFKAEAYLLTLLDAKVLSSRVHLSSFLLRFYHEWWSSKRGACSWSQRASPNVMEFHYVQTCSLSNSWLRLP